MRRRRRAEGGALVSNAHTRSYALPFGFSAEFSYTPGGPLVVAWSPDIPRIRKTRPFKKFFAEYTAARNDFLREIAALVDGNVMVVDAGAQLTHEEILAPSRH
jgi:hypothetical protein